MSVYSTLHGTVRLDAAAASFFTTTPSWQWCVSGDDDEDRVVVSSSEDGSLMLDFASRCYRNLARYIHVDLAIAQEHGAVVGTITDDCSDGVHSRTVTRFDGRTAVTGSGDCFRQPVAATTGCVVELIASSDAGPGLSAFVSATLAEALGTVVLTGAVEGVVLVGAPAVDACGCDGWDDDTDEPVCANA